MTQQKQQQQQQTPQTQIQQLTQQLIQQIKNHPFEMKIILITLSILIVTTFAFTAVRDDWMYNFFCKGN